MGRHPGRRLEGAGEMERTQAGVARPPLDAGLCRAALTVEGRSVTSARFALPRDAGLETGGPLPNRLRRLFSAARSSEHPGEFREDRPVVHEFVVELRGSFLVGEL